MVRSIWKHSLGFPHGAISEANDFEGGMVLRVLGVVFGGHLHYLLSTTRALRRARSLHRRLGIPRGTLRHSNSNWV